MESTCLPEFPPLAELRRLCRRVTRAVHELTLADHHVLIHEVRPNNIQPGHTVREHVHSFYEAHILLAGRARYTMGINQMLERGGALLHAPHSPHAWEEPDTPCLRLLVWFSMEPAVPAPRPASWPIWPDLLWDAALLLDEAAAMRPGWDQRAQARLTVILSRLLSIANWPPSSEAEPPSPGDLVAVIDQFLRDNLARPLSLSDVAAHAGLSQRSLCRQFPRLTGATVMERLSNLRMDRAAALLAETHASVYQVGARVGMADPSYFCRRFRRHFHITPQTYRKQVRR